MDKTLNDRVEEVFRGLVFVLFSFVASLFILVSRPTDGYALLVKRAHRRRNTQIRPYAFLFLAFLVVFFAPDIVDSLSPPKISSFEYQVHDSEFPEVAGALGRAYDTASKRVETKAASAFLIAAVTGVAVFHLSAIVSGVCLMRRRTKQDVWRDSLFFIGGMQISLLGLAVILDRWSWPSRAEVAFFTNFLMAPLNLFQGWSEIRAYPIYVDALGAILLLIILLAPLGIGLRYALRLDRRFWLTWPPQSRSKTIAAAFIIVISDVTMLSSFSLAAYVADEIQPHEKPVYPFTMQYLSCNMQKEVDSDVITGSVTVRAAAVNAWDFEDGDFDLFISAKRIKSDPPPRARSRVATSDRIGASTRIRSVSLTAASPNLGSPPFLLQAGQAALLSFRAVAPIEVISFLAAHPDDHRCTLSYTQDYPIGAIGILRRSDK